MKIVMQLAIAVMCLSACSSNERDRPADTSRIVPPSSAATSPGLWGEADCGVDTTRAHLDPVALINEFLARDTTGAFAKSDTWFETAVECPIRVPGFDSATLVEGYAITPARSNADTATFEVRYQRYGVIGQDSVGQVLEHQPGVELDTLTAVRTPYGWRIGGFVHQPHVSPAGALANLRLRGSDLRTLDSLRSRSRPGV
jgi:hypothetical protein